jgi:hypothetical protein
VVISSSSFPQHIYYIKEYPPLSIRKQYNFYAEILWNFATCKTQKSMLFCRQEREEKIKGSKVAALKPCRCMGQKN